MKKKWLILSVSLILGMSAFALTACGNKGGTPLTHVPAVDATCTATGNIEYWTDGTKYYADESGSTELSLDDVTVQKLSHTPAAAWTTTDADQHWHTCTVCGNPADTKQNHTFSFVIDVEPDLNTVGSKHEECTVCHKQKAPVAIAKIQHVEADPATCTDAGNIEYWIKDGKYYDDVSCTNEHEIDQDGTVDPQKPHEPTGNWISDGAGKHYHMCQNGSHSAGDDEACEAASNAVYTSANSDGGEHWKTCEKCAAPVESLAHEWVWETDTPASDTAPGVKHEECTVCARTRNENTPIPMIGHVEHHEAHAPDCTNPGNIEYWELDDKYYNAEPDPTDPDPSTEITDKSSVVISATGHDFANTLTSSGGYHYYACTNTNCDAKSGTTLCTAGADPEYAGNGTDHWQLCKDCRGVVNGTTEAHNANASNIEYVAQGGDTHKLHCKKCDHYDDPTACTPDSDWHTLPAGSADLSAKHAHNCTLCGSVFEASKTEHTMVWDNQEGNGATHGTACVCSYTSTANCTAGTAWESGSGKHWHECTVCSGKVNSSEADHNNAESLGYTKTSTGHSKVCECGEVIVSEQSHEWAYESLNDGAKHNKTCSVCDYDGGEENCTQGEWVNTDASQHWHACSVCSGVYGSKTAHQAAADIQYVTDSDGHSKSCECGKVVVSEQSHEWAYESLNDGAKHNKTCSVCDYDGGEENCTQGEWVNTDASQHWHACSVCSGVYGSKTAHQAAADVQYVTDSDGHSKSCECGKVLVAKTAHDNSIAVFVEDAGAQYGGRFKMGCSQCGMATDTSAIPVAPDNGYYDRTIKINNVDYGAYSCYTNAELKDKGVSFNPLANDGLFVVDASMFADDLTIEANNTNVAVVVYSDTTVNSLSFTAGWKNAYIRGEGKLTVKALSSFASTLFIETAVDLTIESGDGATLHNTQINGGALNICAPANNGGSGINLGDYEIKVDAQGSLAVSGFTNGIYGGNGKLTVNGGSVVIDAIKHGTAGINIGANGGSIYVKSVEHHTISTGWEEAGAEHTVSISGGATVTVESSGTDAAAMYNMNVTVDGNSTLIVSANWGTKACALTFTSGKATFLSKNVGNNAAFRGSRSITIAQGFDLGGKDFAQMLYEGDPTISVADGVSITTESIANYDYDGSTYCDALEQYCTAGTVTPSEVSAPAAA